MGIFNFFGSILGYLLWFLYTIFKNYGVAIILFTIILKLCMFPLSIKQQRSLASQQKLAAKQRELQKMYANNRQKMNEEMQKLYDKEGVSPTSGCLTTLLPFPIMLGIFYSVIMPLSNTLHISAEAISKATDYISKIPGMVSVGNYAELEIIHNFDALKANLTMFSADELSKIEFFSEGFKFLGLDLLATPKGAAFSEFLWLIPVLSLVFNLLFQFITNKTSGAPKQQGCMMVMMYALPLISVYWAYIMPAAVGFYWVISSVVSFIQTWVTNKFFSVNHMTAMAEAQRVVTLELAEANVKPLPASQQKEIAERLAAAPQQQKQKESGKQKQTQKKKKSSGDSAAYMGNKK